MDLPILLAVEIPDAWIYAAGAFVTGTVGPGAVAFLRWAWNRELAHQAEIKKAVDDERARSEKDEAATRERYKAIIDGLNARAEELSKKLSTKSDEHASKIQELMTLTIQKLEGLGDKNGETLDRALTVMADFTAAVRGLAAKQNSDSGPAGPRAS